MWALETPSHLRVRSHRAGTKRRRHRYQRRSRRRRAGSAVRRRIHTPEVAGLHPPKGKTGATGRRPDCIHAVRHSLPKEPAPDTPPHPWLHPAERLDDNGNRFGDHHQAGCGRLYPVDHGPLHIRRNSLDPSVVHWDRTGPEPPGKWYTGTARDRNLPEAAMGQAQTHAGKHPTLGRRTAPSEVDTEAQGGGVENSIATAWKSTPQGPRTGRPQNRRSSRVTEVTDLQFDFPKIISQPIIRLLDYS